MQEGLHLLEVMEQGVYRRRLAEDPNKDVDADPGPLVGQKGPGAANGVDLGFAEARHLSFRLLLS